MRTIVGIAELTNSSFDNDASFDFKIFETDGWDMENLQQEIPKIILDGPIENVTHLSDGPESKGEAILQHIVQTQLGCKVRCFDLKHSSGKTSTDLKLASNILAVAVRHPTDITIRGSQTSSDFFDMLRKLDEALREISEHIRGINDPTLKDARLKQLQASADALRCYIDLDDDTGPEKLPVSAVQELDKNLKSIDQRELSKELREWLKIVKDYVVLFLKMGGS